MTGFLFNLISRSTARIPAIQPRLASLFEPQRGAVRQPIVSPSFAHGDTWTTSAGVDEDRPDNPRIDTLQADEAPGRGAHPPVENPMTIPLPHEIAVHTNSKHLAATHDPRQAMTPELAGAANGREHQAAGTLPSLVRLTAPSALSPPPSISGVLQRLEKPRPALSNLHPTKPGHRNDTLDDRESPLMARSSGPQVDHTVAHGQGFVERSTVALREPIDSTTRAHPAVGWNARATNTQLNFRSAENLSEITRPEPAPESVVHVSIDRIEVRAVAPAAPSTRSERSAQPVMSLKEYLRRRAPERNVREAS